jgi:WD40 repeat protein
VDEFVTSPMATTLSPSSDGTLLLSLTNTGTALVYRLETRILNRLEGHSSKLTAIAAPSSNYPYIITGDTNGHVRSWALPAKNEWLIARVNSGIYSAAFSPDGKVVAVDGDLRVVRMVALDTGDVTELTGHTADVLGVMFSPSGRTLLSASFDGTARAWRVSDGHLMRTFTSHGAHIDGAAFVNEDTIVSAGEDGRMFRWSVDGSDAIVLLAQASPLYSLKKIDRTGELIVLDADMRIWSLNGDRRRLLYTHDDHITFFKVSSKEDYVIIGDARGNVILLSTLDWHPVERYHMGAAIRAAAIDAQSTEITIAAKDGAISRFSLREGSRLSWAKVSIAARDVQYAPDGDHLGFVTQNDGTWIYSTRRSRWSFWQSHDLETRSGQFTPDGRFFLTFDATGQIISHVVP